VARIVIEVIILCLFLWAAVSLSRRWSGQRRAQHPSSAVAAAPTEASWRATHVGTEKNQTEVVVVLQVPGGTDVWDRRICTVIENQDPDTTNGSTTRSKTPGPELNCLTACATHDNRVVAESPARQGRYRCGVHDGLTR
jgi:hypothetical protein